MRTVARKAPINAVALGQFVFRCKHHPDFNRCPSGRRSRRSLPRGHAASRLLLRSSPDRQFVAHAEPIKVSPVLVNSLRCDPERARVAPTSVSIVQAIGCRAAGCSAAP